jgi:Arc/MetJ-type ribon-helix-helix transcriptional regulator
MAKSISVKRKRRGRPATGVDPLVGVRLPSEMLSRLDRWATDVGLNRSEAIRRLLERTIASAPAKRQLSTGAKRKAADLAGEAIDRLGDQAATGEERASRKRRLIKGPREFRDIRADHPKSKS